MVYRAGSTPEWLICALPAIPAFNNPAARIRRSVPFTHKASITFSDAHRGICLELTGQPQPDPGRGGVFRK
jgi:hypothetical protein